MSDYQLKKQIKEWAQKVGARQAMVALVNGGLGLSTAEKLVKGTYRSKPKEIRGKLEIILAGAS